MGSRQPNDANSRDSHLGSDPHPPRYSNTQHAPLYGLVGGFGVVFAVVGLTPMEEGEAYLSWIFIGTAVFMILLAISFVYLRVEDDPVELGLRVRFGPLPLFGTRIPYEDIESIEVARSSWLDGWGVHWAPGRGWIYNLWGFSCVEIHRSHGPSVRVGTNDAQRLVRFLREVATASRPSE